MKELALLIEINRKLNHNLEAMAQALYDYWFVQFDFPDENGRPYKSSGGKMVWNEQLKREIPEGWKITPLSSHAEITMGSSPNGSSLNEAGQGMPFFQGCTDFGEVFPKERVFTLAPRRFARAGSCLISVRAPVGKLNTAGNKCAIGRGVAALQSTLDAPAHLWQTLIHLAPYFQRYEGEGSIFGCINKDELCNLLVVSSHDLIKAYQVKMNSLYTRRLSIALETNKLQHLRDFLLPLLMNGQVQVRPQGELNYDLHLLTIARFQGSDTIPEP